MQRWLVLGVLLCAAAAAQQAPIPMSDDIGGRPYAIQNKWVIGGVGNWDYMALDPVTRQLFLTHQTSVQVVDVGSGQLAGTITGFGEAHAVVLDARGQFGYVSDGRANAIKVFDRRSLRIEKTILLTCSPRSMVLVPDEDLLLGICGSAPPSPPAEPARQLASAPNMNNRRASNRPNGITGPLPKGNSRIAVIDTEKQRLLTYVTAPGDFRLGQASGDGNVYVTVGPEDTDTQPGVGWHETDIARIDVAGIAAVARGGNSDAGASGGGPAGLWSVPKDWNPYISYVSLLSSSCPSPKGLAVDDHGSRLLVACDNQKLLIVDSVRGTLIDTLTTGPGTDAIAYDERRGLIFTANGGGYGSMTVIRRDVMDSYAVIQNLPTMERARTMALDPSSGRVYLVTDLHGAKLDHPPASGIGSLKLEPVDGSFQVLVIGN